jgi:hypothetical protein
MARSVNELARRVIVSDALRSHHRSPERFAAAQGAMSDGAENTPPYRF